MGRRITSVVNQATAEARPAIAPLHPGQMANKKMYGSGKGSKNTTAVKALGLTNRS